MQNPYEVLEINRDASDDEIKKAYRELAKKYHPDNFKDNPLADLANEKMKQINEAYDEIQKNRSSHTKNNRNGYTYYYNADSGTHSNYPRIRELINGNRYSEAEIALDSVSQSERDAEWYFLKGVLYTKREWYFDAQKYFETACSLDPTNNEYKNAYYSMKNRAGSFYSNGGYNTSRQQNMGCSACDICTGLICADCLCECLGGDLIRCC